VIATALTVTLADPVALSFNDWDVGVFKDVLPNEMLVAFTDSAAVPAARFRDTVREVLPVVAVNVTDLAVLTAATSAVNTAVFCVAGTVIEFGTFTDELLLARDTVTPAEGAAPDKLTVQESAS